MAEDEDCPHRYLPRAATVTFCGAEAADCGERVRSSPSASASRIVLLLQRDALVHLYNTSHTQPDPGRLEARVE